MRTRDQVKGIPNSGAAYRLGRVCEKCGVLHKKCYGHRHSDGKACNRTPILGATVCPSHGGQLPSVKKAALKRVRDAVFEVVDPKRLLREAAHIATFQVTDILNDDGSFKPLSQWNERALAAVGGVELVKRNMNPGDGQTEDVIKVKVWDKNKSISDLFRHHGLYNDKLELLGQVDLVSRLQAGRKRVADAAKR